MADYPSAPQYGQLNLSPWPPNAATQSQSPQHQNVPSSYAPFPHQTPIEYSSTPLNSDAFEANSRIPGLGGFFAPPPAPLSADTLDHFAQPPVASATVLPLPESQASVSSIPGLGADPSFVARRSSEEVSHQTPDTALTTPNVEVEEASDIISYREEGELSDGELEEDTSDVEVSNRSEMGNALPKPTEEPSLSEDDDSVSSYNPPSVSSVKVIDSPERPTISLQDSVADLKTKAKGAILSLLPHNITFQNLVDEGVDQSVLRQLYEEAGIKDTSFIVKSPDVPVQPILRHEQQNGAASTQQKADALAPAALPPAALPPAALHASKEVLSLDSAAAKSLSLNPQVQPTKTEGISVASSAAVERKDRIAQLLALKAAKTTTPQGPSNSLSPAAQPALQTSTSAKDVPAKPSAPKAEGLSKAASVMEDQVGTNKKKAQTDLVRAKMEALKQQALAKAQAQRAAQSMAPNAAVNTTQSSSSHMALAEVTKTLQRPNGPLVMPQSLRDAVVGNGETGRTPQKRPLAADLFDEATPPAKRHVAQKVSHDDVEFVSDEEGEISDVGMDLDDDSDLSEGEVEEVSRTIISRQPQAVGTSTSKSAVEKQALVSANLSDSSVAASAPVTPVDQQVAGMVSGSKDDQIATMKKRIAEMELRKKAKQIAIDQGRSPGPGTPAPADLKSAATSSVVAIPKYQSVGDASARAEALKRRLIRRREIQAGIPLIDAEVERTRSRLAEIQREAERLEAELQKGIQGRQQLLRELESLGVDTENITVEKMRLPELKAVRDELVEAQKQRQQSPEKSEQDPSTASPAHVSELMPTRAESTGPGHALTPEVGSSVGAVPSRSDRSSSEDSAMDESSISSEEATPEVNEAEGVQDVLDLDTNDETMELDSHGGTSLTPADIEEASLQPPIRPDVSEDIADEGSDDESQSVSMSDSESEGSEEYEPAESNNSDVKVTDPTILSSNEHADGENEPGDTDLSTEHQNEPAVESSPEKAIPDLENSNELTESNIMVKPHEPNDSNQESTDIEPNKPGFVPYDSVLKNFRNYRFNQQFTDQVPGGYRSLTYSSKIDSRKVLCRTEANGEICNDPNCEDQHFAQMGLPDDKILVEMSSASGLNKDARNLYVNGLKSVIGDLRSRGVKDFEQVAKELAAYRRRFEAEQDPLLAPTSDAAPPDPLTSV